MPLWCDMTCPEADWPKEEGMDGSGSCRTFLAVYCKKYKQINMKNAVCLDEKISAAKKKSAPKKASQKKTAAKSKTASKTKSQSPRKRKPKAS